MAQEESPSSDVNIATMLRLAHEARLAQSPEWYKINLYHRTWGGVKSRVDDSTFFMAKDGRNSPEAELDETIRHAYDNSLAENSRQPRPCRWIARYQYLSRSMRALGFDYPSPHCEGFEHWKSGLAQDGVSLVFAAVYLNHPASLYGHIFLRFDSARTGEFNRLNDATVGYTVQSEGGFGVAFLVRSLTGGFPGTFVSVPYFMKIREYADLENRDLWEYKTNLSPDEIAKMQAFIWQHSFTYMDYYFFDDNCAMMVLAALEAARPSLNLIEGAKPWIMPLDSIKAARKAGLIVETRYRPSQYHTLTFNYERAAAPVQKQSMLLASRMDSDVISSHTPQDELARILDLAMGIVEYKRNQASTEEEARPYNRFQLKLSNRRSRINAKSEYLPAPPPSESPDEGHDSFRVGIISGCLERAGYARINLRGSYHDGLDPQSGFPPGASSKIGDLYLRVNDNRLRFERLDLFEVFMPTVRTPWHRSPSVKASVSIRRDVQRDGVLSPAALRIELGGGAGWRLTEGTQTYFLADSVARLGPDSNLALGLVSGWIAKPQGKWRAEASMEGFWYVGGKRHDSALYRTYGAIAWDMGRNQNNIRFSASRQWGGGRESPMDNYRDIQLGYFHYF